MWSTHATVVPATLCLLLAGRPAHAADCRHLPAPDRPRAVANDNRVGGGTLRDGVVTLRLVVRDVSWYPDGPNGCALRVRAFAEEGNPALIPGPLIRVRAGTEVRASVRNTLRTTLWVRGLHDRDTGILDSAEVAPGAGLVEYGYVGSIPHLLHVVGPASHEIKIQHLPELTVRELEVQL